MAQLQFKISHVTVALLLLITVLGFVQLNEPFSQWQWENSMMPHRMTVDPFVYTWHARQVYQSEDLYTFTDNVWGLDYVIPTYPPHQGILTASIGKLTSVHVHQLEWILVVLETILVPLGMFIVARRVFNDKVALWTLVLGMFAPANWFFKTYIGHWGDTLSFFFVPVILFLVVYLSNRESKRRLAAAGVIGILLAGMFMAHASEVVYVAAFCGAWLVGLALFKVLPRKAIVEVAVMSGVALILVAHFFPVMFQITEGFGGKLPGAGKLPSYYPPITFGGSDGGTAYFSVVIILATLVGILYLGQRGFSKKLSPERYTVIGLIVFLALVGATYFLGSGYRVFRIYYNWYFIFVIITGLGITITLRAILKNGGLKSFEPLVHLALVLIIGVILFGSNHAFFESLASRPIIDQNKWDAVQWISDNTPEDAIIFNPNGYPHGFAIYFSDRDTLDAELGNDLQLATNILPGCRGEYPAEFAVRCNGGWSVPKRNEDWQSLYITERTGYNSFKRSLGPLCADFSLEQEEGFQKKSFFVPTDYPDYILLQYRGTEPIFSGQNYDPCMAFFINASLARGGRIAWNNDKMLILEVGKDEQA